MIQTTCVTTTFMFNHRVKAAHSYQDNKKLSRDEKFVLSLSLDKTAVNSRMATSIIA